jgi:hypothetical protein
MGVLCVVCSGCSGLSIYNGVILDVRFPMVVYKKLLRQKLGIKDLATLRPVRQACSPWLACVAFAISSLCVRTRPCDLFDAYVSMSIRVVLG